MGQSTSAFPSSIPHDGSSTESVLLQAMRLLSITKWGNPAVFSRTVLMVEELIPWPWEEAVEWISEYGCGVPHVLPCCNWIKKPREHLSDSRGILSLGTYSSASLWRSLGSLLPLNFCSIALFWAQWHGPTLFETSGCSSALLVSPSSLEDVCDS